ncbi:MAG: hypothetical protein RBJ76_10630 [Stenomitos frigidus ULC029]
MEHDQASQLRVDSNPKATADSALQTATVDPAVSLFKLSPLIRLTLLLLYSALTLPLPFLADMTAAVVPSPFLWVGISLGGVLLYAALSERVVLNSDGIQVTYAAWVPRFFRRGWSLSWSDVAALKPRSTGQGGLVYYFVNQSGEAYLLPMRVAGFNRMVQRVQAETSLDMTDVRPLAQPWMYFILLGCTMLLLAIDAWTIVTALSQTV